MTFDEWFLSKQGEQYDSMYVFARDAWTAAQEVERIKHQAEIQRMTTLANTAKKWRGIAMSRDGRTVQEVQAEAVAAEREACAKIANKQGTSSGQRIAENIRARGS